MSLKKILVKNSMIGIENCPTVQLGDFLKIAIDQMDSFKLGIVCIIDNKKKLHGIITDGDFRRSLLRNQKPLSAILVDDAINFAIKSPSIISENDLLIDAINKMNEKQIWDLPIINSDNEFCGLLHLHTAIINYLNVT